MGDKRYRVVYDDEGQVTRVNITDQKPWQQKRGHMERRSGGGFHEDKREKRNKTRQNKLRSAIEDER